jgi:hypothetical protein
LRNALRRHLAELAADHDVAAYEERPLSSEQTSLANIADWVRPKNGATWPLRRDELWLAGTPGGDRPVLVLTRGPVADRIGALV